MRAMHLFAAGLLLVCAAAHAQSVSVEEPGCIPRKGNGAVRASITPDPSVGQSPRLYFRWSGQADFYWVPMEVEPGSRYWGVLPRPEERNQEVELYVAVVNAEGRTVARSEPRAAKVRSCQVELGPRERGVAENLIVGETTAAQYGKKVVGFLCPGIKMRIDHQGVRRADEECGPCGLAWLAPTLATAGVLGVVVVEDREASPSRP